MAKKYNRMFDFEYADTMAKTYDKSDYKSELEAYLFTRGTEDMIIEWLNETCH